jgi:hypothetical protein
MGRLLKKASIGAFLKSSRGKVLIMTFAIADSHLAPFLLMASLLPAISLRFFGGFFSEKAKISLCSVYSLIPPLFFTIALLRARASISGGPWGAFKRNVYRGFFEKLKGKIPYDVFCDSGLTFSSISSKDLSIPRHSLTFFGGLFSREAKISLCSIYYLIPPLFFTIALLRARASISGTPSGAFKGNVYRGFFEKFKVISPYDAFCDSGLTFSAISFKELSIPSQKP